MTHIFCSQLSNDHEDLGHICTTKDKVHEEEGAKAKGNHISEDSMRLDDRVNLQEDFCTFVERLVESSITDNESQTEMKNARSKWNVGDPADREHIYGCSHVPPKFDTGLILTCRQVRDELTPLLVNGILPASQNLTVEFLDPVCFGKVSKDLTHGQRLRVKTMRIHVPITPTWEAVVDTCGGIDIVDFETVITEIKETIITRERVLEFLTD